MKVFLDTNVIVSAVTTRGLCADVFRTVLAEHELITSSRVLQEVRRILKVKFEVPDVLIAEYLELIEQDAVMAEFKDLPNIPIKDKDDIEIVAAAVSASAHVLVTGDREVQSIKSFKNVRVMSPRAFWEELTANHAL
jgi:putative PIN family toxin of toxin-antitoxin system